MPVRLPAERAVFGRGIENEAQWRAFEVMVVGKQATGGMGIQQMVLEYGKLLADGHRRDV